MSPYGAMPSRLLPIDADGTVVGQCATGSSSFGPVSSYPSGAVVIGWVTATATPAFGGAGPGYNSGWLGTFCFFPEARTILGGIFAATSGEIVDLMQGSSDTTNGADGTWETASWPSGLPTNLGTNVTTWRDSVKPATFSGAKTTVRLRQSQGQVIGALHLYGVKASGQTPDDVIFLDGDTSFTEYTVDKDFGDRPLGTTVVKQFKIKNVSSTHTATTILVTCNDTDFAISNDGVTYGTSFTIPSLGPGVSSGVLYIRNTTPSPGAPLGPRQVRLSAAVDSYV